MAQEGGSELVLLAGAPFFTITDATESKIRRFPGVANGVLYLPLPRGAAGCHLPDYAKGSSREGYFTLSKELLKPWSPCFPWQSPPLLEPNYARQIILRLKRQGLIFAQATFAGGQAYSLTVKGEGRISYLADKQKRKAG